MEIKTLPIGQLERNEGQIQGLPKNPRLIRDERFEALKKSIQDAPDMLELRELLVYPLGKDRYVVIGGNMRLAACTDLGYTELPCKVIDKKVSVKKLREITIKDNENYGQPDWALLAEEWDLTELKEWGVECDFLDGGDVNIDEFFKEAEGQRKGNDSLTITVEVPKEFEDNLEDIKAAVKVTLEEWEGCKVK
jgi:hypothetical protein